MSFFEKRQDPKQILADQENYIYKSCAYVMEWLFNKTSVRAINIKYIMMRGGTGECCLALTKCEEELILL